MSLSFPVSPKKQEALFLKMKDLGIREEDIQESFYRSSGNGGQNVNKVSTAVRVYHPTSGIEVKCNVYRTQGLNRYKARAILCDRLESKRVGEESKLEKRFAKIRKSKEDKKRKAKRKKLEKLQSIQSEKYSDGMDEVFSPLQ